MLLEKTNTSVSTVLSLLDFPWVIFKGDGTIQAYEKACLKDSMLIDPEIHSHDIYQLLDSVIPAFSLTLRPAIENGADPQLNYPVHMDDGRFYTLSVRRLEPDKFIVLFRNSTEVDYVEAASKAKTWMDSRGAVGFSLIDLSGNLCSWNVSTRSIFLYKRTEILGKNISFLFDNNQDDVIEEGISTAVERGWFEKDTFLKKKDGSSFSARVIFSLQRDTNYLIFSVADLNWANQVSNHIHTIAAKDSLTGAYNRRYFTDIMNKELMRYRRYGGQFSIIMLDADHFKSINDTYGHEGGDFVLRALVQYLKNTVRKVDVVARLGGEEFAILLPSTHTLGAVSLAERLCQQISKIEVDYQGNKINFTTSIGVSATNDREQSIDDILRSADNALYKAKQKGRNRVEVQLPKDDGI